MDELERSKEHEIMGEDELNLPQEMSPSVGQSVAVSDTSETAGADVSGIPTGEIGHYPLSGTLKEISDHGVKGTTAMLMLYANVHRLETDLADEKRHSERLRDDLGDLQARHHVTDKALAVASEKLDSARRTRVLQNVLLTLGGLAFGNGLQMLTLEITGISSAISLFGVVLLIVGWFLPTAPRVKA